MTRTVGLLLVGLTTLPVAQLSAADPAGDTKLRGWEWVKLDQAARLCFESGVAFDSSADRLVLWGGHKGYGGPQRAETWLFDPAEAKWKDPEPANRPIGACCVKELVYDPALRRTYYFGGHSYNHGWQWLPPRGRGGGWPWAYDASANTWRCMKPLTFIGRCWTGAVYDPNHQVVITYGGENYYETDVWVYDGYANEWTVLKQKGEGPTMGGHCPAMAYDSENRVVLMFGHGYGKDAKPALWRYDLAANAWTQLPSSDPMPRRVNNMFVYDPVNRMPILFAPQEDRLAAFAYDRSAGSWKQLTVEGPAPPPYTNQQGAYDPVRHQTIFANGGSYSVQNRPATYLFRHARPAAASASLPAVHGLQAVTTADGKVELTFQPVAGADTYPVYRASGARPWEVAYESIGRATGGRFVDQKPVAGAVNFYYVQALDSKGNRQSVSAKVRAQPAAPAQPVVSVQASGQVEIAFARSSETDVVGYNVYQFTGFQPMGKGRRAADVKKLNDSPLSAPSYTCELGKLPEDSQAGPFFLVRAVNRLGIESGPSPWADTFASEPTGLVARLADGKAVLTWNPNPEKAVQGYSIYRVDSSTSDVKTMARRIAGPVRETRFVDGSKSDVKTCKYYVVAIDAAGREGRASHGAWFNEDGRN